MIASRRNLPRAAAAVSLACALAIAAAGVPPVRMNALIAEDSSYLRSLSSSRIDWRAWGPAACAEAAASGKPIFLSIGYASCLWSARMDRAVFSNARVADLLNAGTIPVKVDRFEHPDLDRWCQRAVEAAGQPGGWPLTVWMTPEGLPVRGVVFPNWEEEGADSLVAPIEHFLKLWASDAAYVRAQARRDAASLAERVGAALAGEVRIDADLLANARGKTLAQLDPRHGGFGTIPKFASPARLAFLMREAGRVRSDASLAAVTLTLDALARGGLRDHVGGGFFRYAMDDAWARPYFEKQALDQAQLADSYLSAHRLIGAESYAAVARDTLSYALRELSHPGGGMFTGEHCESEGSSGEPVEGAFYLWTAAAFAEAAGPHAAFAEAAFGIREEGNLPVGSGRSAFFAKANLPVPDQPLEPLAARFGLRLEPSEAAVLAARESLAAVRSLRPRPALDRLQTTQTTAAFVSVLCRAGLLLREPEFLARARHGAAFLESTLWDEGEGRVYRACLDRPARLAGVAEDYAFFIRAMLDLHETTGEFRWLALADAVQRGFDRECGDVPAGGWFDTARSAGRALSLKSIDDAGGFSPNAIAGANAVRWSALLADPAPAAAARHALQAFAGPLRVGSPSVAGLFGVAHGLVHPPQRIVLFGDPNHPELRDARTRLAGAPDGRWSVLCVENAQALDWLIRRGALPPHLSGRIPDRPVFFLDGEPPEKEIGRSLQELHKFL